MHLMLQPEIATKLLSDRSLRDQGILSRLNIAAPESLSGQRFYRPINLDHQTAIKRFNDRVFDILQKSPPLAGKVKNELQPRVLKISPSGCELLHNFADNVEAELAKGASLENVRDVGAKAMENACRIAAVLAAFENLDCQEINEDCVTRGIKIADWYLNEAARLANSQVTDPNLQLAQRLLDWLQSQREKTFGIRDLLNRGPSPLRQKKILMPVLKELIDHNWITVVSERPKIFKLNSNS
jgi:hypothetical protein